MSNYSAIPTHVLVFSSTVIIGTADKDEDGHSDGHGCVDNDDADDDEYTNPKPQHPNKKPFSTASCYFP